MTLGTPACWELGRIAFFFFPIQVLPARERTVSGRLGQIVFNLLHGHTLQLHLHQLSANEQGRDYCMEVVQITGYVEVCSGRTNHTIRLSSADQGGPWLQQDSSVFHLIKHQGFLLPFLGSLSQDLGYPGGSVGKESACNAGDPGLIPGSGRSLGEGDGNPLQYSCLENPMYRGAQLATVQAKSWTQLSTKLSLLSQNLKSTSKRKLQHAR